MKLIILVDISSSLDKQAKVKKDLVKIINLHHQKRPIFSKDIKPDFFPVLKINASFKIVLILI